jgi:hypothetical protein
MVVTPQGVTSVVKGVAILSSRVRFPNLATRKWLLRFLLAGKRKGWFQGARMGGKARDGCRVGLKGVLASFARTGTKGIALSHRHHEKPSGRPFVAVRWHLC